MKPIFWHQELYGLLFLCDRYNLDKTVLDCGAGGPRPPLAIFQEHGYITKGIDISEQSIQSAATFEQQQNLDLHIQFGDMRNLNFEDNTFGVVYSYNTIFHMMKEDITKAIIEMTRVLQKGGLLYFNLMTTDDDGVNEGTNLGNFQMKQKERGETIIHCYHEIHEVDELLQSLHLTTVRKTVRSTQVPYQGKLYNMSYIDYILQK